MQNKLRVEQKVNGSISSFGEYAGIVSSSDSSVVYTLDQPIIRFENC